jgi:hypothetical protein
MWLNTTANNVATTISTDEEERLSISSEDSQIIENFIDLL